VIDIVPTILEVTGIPAPVMVDGIAQKPIEDVSLAYTFDKANADAPTPHHDQYFEMMGVQGLYNDGWTLSAVPVRHGNCSARRSRIPPAPTSSSCTMCGMTGRGASTWPRPLDQFCRHDGLAGLTSRLSPRHPRARAEHTSTVGFSFARACGDEDEAEQCASTVRIYPGRV
jgi:hypothetical protein